MKPTIDTSKLLSQQSAALTPPNQSAANNLLSPTAGPDPSLASLISQQILTMQK